MIEPRPGAKLAGELYEKYAHQPILVIGGGPSALDDLAKIENAQDMICVSANAHAFRIPQLKPSYIVSNDHRHTRTKELMAPALRQYGVPIVSRHWWADYRLADWTSKGNSGMNAIGVAVLLGGWPVIPLGMDCFQGTTYFHSHEEWNVSLGRPIGYWQHRLLRMATQLRGAAIRPLSGPMTQQFPHYNTSETLPPFYMPDDMRVLKSQKTFYARALKPFVDPNNDARAEVPAGAVFPVSDVEQVRYVRGGIAEPVGESASIDQVQWLRARRKTVYGTT